MASREVKNMFAEKFLFKEIESKLFIYKKNKENPCSINSHIANIKEFMQLFDSCWTNKSERLSLFWKYFDEDIAKEIKSDVSFREEDDIDDLVPRLVKLLEVKM